MSNGQMNDQHLLLLGEIKGKVDAIAATQDTHGTQLSGLDGRLRTQEQRAAAAGAVGGGVISVGMALLIEAAKGWMGRGGSNP
jgi:hypothetical protein